MSRRGVALGAMALAVVLLAAAGVSMLPQLRPAALSPDDNGRTISAQVGAILTVRLSENPSTGYHWEAATTDGLVITENEYTADDRSQALAGSGGVRTWTLQVAKSGSHEFRADLYPPDVAAGPVSSFGVHVAVP